MNAMRIGVFALLAVLTLPDAAAAQRPRPRPQRVDPLTASISGKVTTADTGAPIRGAEVRLSVDGRYNRLGTTNAEGRYELRNLPAGQYKLVVSRTGFITLEFGQRRPFEASTTITLGEGQSTAASMTLIRGGVITGRVLDEHGEPLAGARVQALRSRTSQGRRRLQSVGPGDRTDDTGAFRVYGLPPGDYFVAASTGVVDAVKRDPPVYYPGTANFAEAQPLTLSAGSEATADFQIVSVGTTRVSGIVLNSSGAPAPGAMVNLVSQTIGMGPESSLMLHADGAPDGTFTIQGVPPGPYVVTAMIMAEPSAGPADGSTPGAFAAETLRRMPENASMSLVVAGEEMSGVTLTARRNGRISGQFVVDAGVGRPVPTNLRVTLRSAGEGGMNMNQTLGRGDMTNFQLAGMGGPVNLEVQGLPDDWGVKAIFKDGTDVTDQAIDLSGDASTLRVVLTDRLTSVNGTVQSRSDIRDHAVIVFADDSSKWTYPSRYVRTTRADADGRFQIRGLPPGERYLAVALDHLEDGDHEDAQFLERLRSRATGFSLRDGEQRSLRVDIDSR